MIKLICPLSITLGINKKKTYYLNLNNYRNWHYQVSNTLKEEFKERMRSQLQNITPIPIDRGIFITYIFYSGSNRRKDLRNITTVIDKFLCDALVAYGIIPDDNCDICNGFMDLYGGIDKDNPRVEAYINEIAN